jgi:DNA-binding GntR family transcriptional regulator
LAARLAAERDTNIAELRRTNDELRRVSELHDPSEPTAAIAVREANDAFHVAILTGAANRRLSDYLGELRTLYQRYETLYFANPARVGSVSADDHDAIIAAIAAHDPDAAAAAMRLHYNRAWNLVSRLRDGSDSGVVAV